MSGRVLALDVGSRRLGVAVSDPSRTVAMPLATVRRDTPAADAKALVRLATEHEAGLIVVGLPLDLAGREAVAARQVRTYVEALAPLLPGIELTFADERLSTVAADRALLAQGVRGPDRRQVVDRVAAAVFLQTWLDRERAARDRAGAQQGPSSRGGPAETSPP